MSFWAYMLHCADGSYYVGHTDNLEARVGQHQSGTIAGCYTHDKRPVALIWSQEFPSRIEALACERQVKGWSRNKKAALAQGDWDAVALHAKKDFSKRKAKSRQSDLCEQDAVAQTGTLRYAAGAATQGERREDTLSFSAIKSVSPSPSVHSSHSGKVAAMTTPPPFALGRDATHSMSKDDLTRLTSARPPQPAIVLVNPQLGENIGKAARAMLNFGLTDLRLVAPRDGWPNPDAGPAAAGADIILERARVFNNLAEAVEDCSHIFATTVRKRGVTKPVFTPEQAAQQIWQHPEQAAIIFGPERSGLETDDVALARAIITVPINPEFGSLNLAQAVILCAYEWSKGAALASPPATELDPPAPQAELDGFIAELDGMLAEKNYFFPEDRAPATRRTLRNLLTKPAWTSLEVRTLRGVLSALNKPPRAR